MNKLTILPFLTVLLVSCDPEMHQFPHENDAAAPTEVVKAPPTPSTYRAPAPVPDADPTAAFLTPKQDRKLPNEEQLADGADSSIGTSTPGAGTPSNQPSTAIKPPSSTPATTSTKEDDLAPSE